MSERERPCVYLLRCADGSLYCGWTADLDRRLAAHAAGRASRYTRSRLPVELALVLPQPTRSAARRVEVLVKRLDREAKLALVAGAVPSGAVAEGGDGEPDPVGADLESREQQPEGPGAAQRPEVRRGDRRAAGEGEAVPHPPQPAVRGRAQRIGVEER
jgi:putative endonuclease